jgi:hypothetical protein
MERKVKDLEQDLKEATPYPRIASLSSDRLCPNFWCKCPYHMKKKQPPPSPPSSSGGAGPSQYSGASGGYDGVGPYYRHNLVGPESGPWSRMGLKDSYNGLANRTLCRCFGPRLAVYLDRYACLNSLDIDS